MWLNPNSTWLVAVRTSNIHTTAYKVVQAQKRTATEISTGRGRDVQERSRDWGEVLAIPIKEYDSRRTGSILAKAHKKIQGASLDEETPPGYSTNGGRNGST
jgi:hypothetical protein